MASGNMYTSQKVSKISSVELFQMTQLKFDYIRNICHFSTGFDVDIAGSQDIWIEASC